MKNVFLESIFLTFIVFLGVLGEPPDCFLYVGRCVACESSQSWTQGIFCENFVWSVGGFNICRAIWYGQCYTSSPYEKFHKKKDQREDHLDGNIKNL